MNKSIERRRFQPSIAKAATICFALAVLVISVLVKQKYPNIENPSWAFNFEDKVA